MEKDNSDEINPILCMNFNQDASCFCLGTITGFCIFNYILLKKLKNKYFCLYNIFNIY